MDHEMKLSAQLAHLAGGMVDDTATQELADLVKAVRDTGRAGKLTITLKVTPFRQNRGDVVKLAGTVKTSAPDFDPPEQLFFATADGSLLRDDPNQTRLPGLESVDPQTGEITTETA